MSAKKWVLTFNKSNLRIVLVGFLLISGVQAETSEFEKLLTQVCKELALKLLDDAEGASHNIHITVDGAALAKCATVQQVQDLVDAKLGK